MKMTVTEYAKLLGVERDTIHKRIKAKVKLKGVTKMERVGSIIVLHVEESKARY
jgi:plasmid maintenance system antidote protein VapI